jgi:hypothetical protein
MGFTRDQYQPDTKPHKTIVCSKCKRILTPCHCASTGKPCSVVAYTYEEAPGACGVGTCTFTYLPRIIKMFAREYPGRGLPWADLLHHRARVLAQWLSEGLSVEEMVQKLDMTVEQVKLILMTPFDAPETAEVDVNDPSADAWRGGLKEAVERMREHLGAVQLRFDARDKQALRFILGKLEGG